MEISSTQIWIIVGVVMFIAELLSVSFVFAFIGVGALFTALLTWIGVLPMINAQLFCFSVVSVLSLFAFRKPLQALTKKSLEYSEYVGDKATVVIDIPADGEGKVFYRGTEWIALSKSHERIHKGKSVVIKELDGIRLIVGE